MKSNCCNADIIENTDLCSQCKEHCEAVNEFDELMKVEDKVITYNGKRIK